MLDIKKKSKVSERQLRALHLREQGFTYKEIARMLGYCDASGARKAVVRAQKQTFYESIETTRRLQYDFLELLKNQYSPRAIAGDINSIDMVLRILELECILLGSNEPKQK